MDNITKKATEMYTKFMGLEMHMQAIIGVVTLIAAWFIVPFILSVAWWIVSALFGWVFVLLGLVIVGIVGYHVYTKYSKNV